MLASLLAAPTIALSQARYSGVWEKGDTPLFTIADFGFADSLNGVAVDGASYFAVTSDGGHSWQGLGRPQGGISVAKPCLNMVACNGPRKAVVTLIDCSKLELDGDTIIFEPCYVAPYFTLAQKMYDTSYGFRFMHIPGFLLDTTRIFVTHDAWENYASYGSPFPGPNSFDGATMVDSNEVWVGINKAIYRTTNSGASWDTIYPLAGSPDSNVNPGWYNFIVNHATHEIYAKAALPPIDFAYSSDDGKTWRLDSTFKGRMGRLSVTAPNTLWAIIGRHTLVSPPIDLGGDLGGDFDPSYFSKMLAYSTDNGTSWYIDSVTFAGDSTILEMHWLDPRHGWIATSDENTAPSAIWYYNAPPSGVTASAGIENRMIQAYPNPVENILHLFPALPNIEATDPLGRSYPLRNIGNAFDVSNLPPGLYFIDDGGVVRGKFVKE